MVGKKGVAYILTSLLVVGLVVANMAVFADRFRKGETASVALVRDEFTETLIQGISEQGLEDFLQVAAKNALSELATEQRRRILAGEPLGDINKSFAELVLNGSLDGERRYEGRYLLSYFGITTKAYRGLGFSIDKVTLNTTLEQVEPFHVEVEANVTFAVVAPSARLSWAVDTTKRLNVSIFGFQDPVSPSLITNQWQPNSLHPNFLDRMNGISAAHPLGICLPPC